MLAEIVLTSAHIEWLREQRVFFENTEEQYRLRPGQKVSFSQDVRVEPYVGILNGFHIGDIGSFSYIGSPMPLGVKIGRYCSIADGLTVPLPRHPLERASTSSFVYDRNFSILKSHLRDVGKESQAQRHFNPQKPLPTIGNDVWIGQACSLMPGIHVGNGAVVAAGSVVTKDVPDYAIVGGNPAKLIRYRFPNETVSLMQSSAWWRFAFSDFQDAPTENPEAFATHILEQEHAGKLRPYTPSRVELSHLTALTDTV